MNPASSAFSVRWDIFLLTLGMCLVTYIPRALPALFGGRLRLQPWAQRFLNLIPCAALTALIFPDATESIGQNAFADCYNLRSVSFGRGMKEIGTYSFTGYDWTGTGQGGCPLLGEIICRATTPPTLEESYGSGPFGGSYEIIAGSKAETRVIHLPESDDPSLSTGGGYVNSGWVQLTMAPYNFTFVYDVEPTGTWK